jgi:hypothetical protein
MSVVERLGDRDHWKNVDLAFKKVDLRTWIKTTTDVGEKTVNEEDKAPDTMEKPKYQGSLFKLDKSYETTNKISKEVKRAKETSSQTPTHKHK